MIIGLLMFVGLLLFGSLLSIVLFDEYYGESPTVDYRCKGGHDF